MSLTGSEHVICICTLYMRYEYNMYIIYIIYEVWIYYVYIYIYARICTAPATETTTFWSGSCHLQGSLECGQRRCQQPPLLHQCTGGVQGSPLMCHHCFWLKRCFSMSSLVILVQVFPSPKSFQSRASSWPLIWLCEQIVMGNLKIRFIMNGNSILRIGSDIE
jgi:hypothetical protein